jgi:hypothetical protein
VHEKTVIHDFRAFLQLCSIIKGLERVARKGPEIQTPVCF